MTDGFTCTDVIEEIISEEIVDETDQFEDNQSKRRAKRMTTAAVMRGYAFSLFSRVDNDDGGGGGGIGLSRESVDSIPQTGISMSARHCWRSPRQFGGPHDRGCI
jgi:hypothetical protein